MGRVVRIDDDNWDFAKRHANPLEDNFNSVLRRLFTELEELRRSRRDNATATVTRERGSRSPVMPRLHVRAEYGRRRGGLRQSEFWIPILRAIESLGGAGRMADILTRVERLVGSELTPLDREALPSDGLERWKKKAQWARYDMVNVVREPLLSRDSPWGVWEITEAGRRFLQQAEGGQR